jgi:hypothetical protein
MSGERSDSMLEAIAATDYEHWFHIKTEFSLHGHSVLRARFISF